VAARIPPTAINPTAPIKPHKPRLGNGETGLITVSFAGGFPSEGVVLLEVSVSSISGGDVVNFANLTLFVSVVKSTPTSFKEFAVSTLVNVESSMFSIVVEEISFQEEVVESYLV